MRLTEKIWNRSHCHHYTLLSLVWESLFPNPPLRQRCHPPDRLTLLKGSSFWEEPLLVPGMRSTKQCWMMGQNTWKDSFQNIKRTCIIKKLKVIAILHCFSMWLKSISDGYTIYPSNQSFNYPFWVPMNHFLFLIELAITQILFLWLFKLYMYLCFHTCLKCTT